jgi:hypothetical protein
LNVSWEHAVANKRLFNDNSPQIRKNSRFDPMAAPGIFSDGYACGTNSSGDGHFNPPAKLTPEVSANISPVLLSQFR